MKKLTVQVAIHKGADGIPTEWFPAIDRASLLALLDHEIQRVESQLRSLDEMRELVEATPSGSEDK